MNVLKGYFFNELGEKVPIPPVPGNQYDDLLTLFETNNIKNWLILLPKEEENIPALELGKD